MILMTRVPEEYIAGTTSLLIDDAGGGYYVDVVKKDAPADFIKRLGHPTTFKESGVGKGQPKENVDSWLLLG